MAFKQNFAVFLFCLICLPVFSQNPNDIEIRRTSYGVPHIKAPTLKGATYGLAWCELEDYGERVLTALALARGDLALIEGFKAAELDLMNQLGYQRTVEMYHHLDENTRNMLEGFAAGVNAYLDKYPNKFPQYKGWQFTGFDVAALNVTVRTPPNGRSFQRELIRRQEIRDSLALTEAGSNAWAFAPSRVKSGNSILVRNPHLSWSAGYYEAHITVPGKLNFYGDFRIGGLFSIIGGFNERLGWATTNNNPDLEEYYALEADPEKADHYILDGTSIPLERKLLEAEFRHGNARGIHRQEFLFTLFGPVIHRAEGKIYVLKAAGDGEYRRCQQFTRMLLAKNLEEWKDAMRMQAITSSNYTYADADGNIFYVWNSMTPRLNHASGGDTAVVDIQSVQQVWKEYIPFDSLPQLLNPPGGYLHNENDPFHFTNLNQILQPEDFPHNFPQPRLRQRSQHSLQLIHNEDKFSLEDVVERKHSMRMLLADQLKGDLVRAVRGAKPNREIRRAIAHIDNWDNLVAAKSRGGVLFQAWFETYSKLMGNKDLYEIPWSFEKPMETPFGIANKEIAVKAFSEAVASVKDQFGAWDLAWGDVHRLRLGDLDLPVGGGPGGLGTFRVLWFEDDEDGKRKIRGGDGWQLAVEFSDPPRAYSILAYGQSNDPNSPHHTDQAKMFANNQMKKVAFSEEEIRADLIRRYKPGE